MKIYRVFFIILTLAPLSLFAIDGLTRVPEPTPEEQAAYKDVINHIADIQKDIAAYYTDLGEKGRILRTRDASGKEVGGPYSEFEITSEVQTYYGQRDRYVYTERIHIDWNVQPGTQAGSVVASVKSVVLTQRRGRVGHGYVLKRRIAADILPKVESENDALPVNLIVNELLDSGKGLLVNFRFPESKDVRDKTGENAEVIEVDGQKKKIDLIYVRSHAEKMRMLREYRDALKLTWRRVDWEVRSEKARNARELERILRRQTDS